MTDGEKLPGSPMGLTLEDIVGNPPHAHDFSEAVWESWISNGVLKRKVGDTVCAAVERTNLETTLVTWWVCAVTIDGLSLYTVKTTIDRAKAWAERINSIDSDEYYGKDR